MAYPPIHVGILRNVPLFAMLDEPQLHALANLMSRKSAPKNRTIIKAGDPTDSLYIVISGRTKVQMSDDEGKEVILSSGAIHSPAHLMRNGSSTQRKIATATGQHPAGVSRMLVELAHPRFRDDLERSVCPGLLQHIALRVVQDDVGAQLLDEADIPRRTDTNDEGALQFSDLDDQLADRP